MHETEDRAKLSAAEINDLPDSAFAYIEPGGKKDGEGKTVPRRLRHYPVPDKAHADDAAARADAAIKAGGDEAEIARKALPKIKAAQAKFGEKKSADPHGHERDNPTPEDWEVGYGLKNLKGDLARVKASQLADPDNKTDPDDEAVMAAIEKAESAIDEAIVAQGKDAKREPRSVNWATAKRAFSSLVEQPPSHAAKIEVRSADGDDSYIARFAGYASTTGVPYQVRDWLGEYQETILPGAFAKTLREQSNVPLLFNHDGIPLASTGSGTSRLSEDKIGLRNEAELDRRDALTNSICVQLSRGVLNRMSFSFKAVKEAWNDAFDDRGVNEAALFDSSIVTFPANDATSGELVDSFRSALGREGRSLWLADSELSVRSALPLLTERRGDTQDTDDLLEHAVRALVAADEQMVRSHGPHGRARTFHLAGALLELRAGKALSAKNQGLLQAALDALSAADKHHAKTAKQHATASDALNAMMPADGESNSKPPSNGNPIMPQDGAGPRSKSLALARQREAELRALRR